MFDADAIINLIRKLLLMSANVVLALLASGQLQGLLNWIVSFFSTVPISGNNALFVGGAFFFGLIKFIPGWIDALASAKSTATATRSLKDDMSVW